MQKEYVLYLNSVYTVTTFMESRGGYNSHENLSQNKTKKKELLKVEKIQYRGAWV